MRRLDFRLESFGPRQLQLTAAPAILAGKNPEILFRELLDDFGGITGDSQKRYQKKAASFACRGALMAGDRMDEPVMRALFARSAGGRKSLCLPARQTDA